MEITKGVLRYYGDIFGIPRSGPRMLELDVPITPILDVSRAAELGSGIGRSDGWVCIDLTAAHVGAGSSTTTQDMLPLISTAVGPSVYDPGQHLPWLFETTVFTATTGIFTSAFQRTGEQVQGTSFIRLWRRWTGALVDTGADVAIPTYEAKYPVPAHGSTFNMTSTSVVTGAANITFRTLFWIGSRGARPPFVS